MSALGVDLLWHEADTPKFQEQTRRPLGRKSKGPDTEVLIRFKLAQLVPQYNAILFGSDQPIKHVQLCILGRLFCNMSG